MFLCLALSGSASILFAQERPQSQSTSDVAEAKVHFEEGRRLFQARRFREAIHAFELARALWPSPDLLFNIARGYEELGDYVAAMDYYERYLQRAAEPSDGDEVRERIAALGRRNAQLTDRRSRGERIGGLRLVSERRPGKVWLAGELRPSLSQGVPLFMPPGDYPLKVAWAGSMPFLAHVQVRAGEVTTAYPLFKSPTPAQVADDFSPSGWFWTGVVVTAVAVTGAAALGTMGVLRREEAPSSADQFAQASDLCLGAAFLSGVIATVTYFAEQP